jgi:hypothetical protein
MNHIGELSECRVGETPLGDILRMVQRELLVVDKPDEWMTKEDLTEADKGKRIPTWAFLHSMERVQKDMGYVRYCDAGSPFFPRPPVGGTIAPKAPEKSASDDLLSPGAAEDMARVGLTRQQGLFLPRGLTPVIGGTRKDYRHALQRKFDKVWTFEVDNDFALNVLEEVGKDVMSPPYLTKPSEQLCSRCKHQTFWSSDFTLDEDPERLKQKQMYCTLCKMMFNACVREGLDKAIRVGFMGSGSTVMLQERPHPVLSIVRSPGKCQNIHRDF